MTAADHAWALILAGGDGSRLRALTTQASGTPIPKQYCSLTGCHSLLEETVARARNVVSPDRICTVVAQTHREWWSEQLADSHPRNVIVQPRNRGTGIGVLYSLLHISHRDPAAQVLLLPADHYVRDETTLRQSLRNAMQRVQENPGAPLLLGVRPEHPDPELGYIIPGIRDDHGSDTVTRFVEKPNPAVAAQIIDADGLWNTFIIAASVQTLINMFVQRYPPLVMEMKVIVSRSLLAESGTALWPALFDLYERLPDIDFSRDLLQGREDWLRVMAVPACGWNDLGTPARVAATLRGLDDATHAQATPAHHLNLAAQQAMLDRSSRSSAVA
ncbi:MAG TPA: sugar phosphate nucleotidyltransferase [Steroidobacteraceae bacterium]|jgi:mannose-1-phosphate guanylyltransferase